MRNGQNNKHRMRGRNRSGGKSHNPLTRVYESNGPDVKIRGTANHVAEKYIQLARDATASGDPVAAENYYQHAEHYFRLIAAAQEQFRQTPPFPRTDGGEQRSDESYDDGDDSQPAYGSMEPHTPRDQQQFQPREQQGYQQRDISRAITSRARIAKTGITGTTIASSTIATKAASTKIVSTRAGHRKIASTRAGRRKTANTTASRSRITAVRKRTWVCPPSSPARRRRAPPSRTVMKARATASRCIAAAAEAIAAVVPTWRAAPRAATKAVRASHRATNNVATSNPLSKWPGLPGHFHIRAAAPPGCGASTGSSEGTSRRFSRRTGIAR